MRIWASRGDDQSAMDRCDFEIAGFYGLTRADAVAHPCGFDDVGDEAGQLKQNMRAAWRWLRRRRYTDERHMGFN
jgi:hypothetical protein